MQSIFSKQFDPNAYDNYQSDYMGSYNELIQPGRDRQFDQFQQSMFNRGMPEGGEIYGDMYRTTVGDPNARQDLMAQGQAQQAGESARNNDYQRLMQAMGLGTKQSPFDPLGNRQMDNIMQMNQDNLDQQDSDNLWNMGVDLFSGYAESQDWWN